MGKMQRSKGAGAERELAQLLHLHLGVRCRRNLKQVRSGGCDLAVHPDETGAVADEMRKFAVEVKRHAKATPGLIATWWEQTRTQAERANLTPALAFRADRAEWEVMIPLSALCPSLKPWAGVEWAARLSIIGFITLVRERATT